MRRLMSGLAVAAAGVALSLFALDACQSAALRGEANANAGALADGDLSLALDELLDRLDARRPHDRARAALDFLTDPQALEAAVPLGVEVRSHVGTKIRVDVFAGYDSNSFGLTAGKRATGVACRELDVAREVVMETVDCPQDSLDRADEQTDSEAE